MAYVDHAAQALNYPANHWLSLSINFMMIAHQFFHIVLRNMRHNNA